MPGYTLAPRARADLVDIWAYSSDRWGRTQADRYARLVDGVFARIARRPSLGHRCDNIRAGYFRFAAGSHVVFYRQSGPGVIVIRVLHQSMDFDRHL